MIKRENLKGFAVGCAVTIVLTAGVGAFSSPVEKMINAVYSGIKLVIDGNEITPKDANGNAIEPFIYNGTTYLPVRAVGEAIGKEVSWDGNSSTVYLGEVPKPIVNINGENINLSDYMVYLNNSKTNIARDLSNSGQNFENGTYNGKSATQAAKDMAMDELLKDVVIEQKAKGIGTVIDESSEKLINDKTNNYINMLGGKEQLKAIGTSENDVRKSVERSYYKFVMYNNVASNISLQPKDEQVKEYFKENYIRARHILILTTDEQGKPLADDAKKKAEEKARAILAQLKGGADFVKLMDENSGDPGSKGQPDGYYFTKGDMVKEFEDASLALKEGEISGIVETKFGYHIIKRESLLEKYDSYMEQNKQDIVQRIMSGVFDKKVEEWVGQAVKNVVQDELDKIVIE